MSLPKQLIQSFEDIKSLHLVLGELTQANVQLFVDLLNKSIPSPMNPMAYTLYRFNRSKYISNKQKFLDDIKNFAPYDSMILWTDFKDILTFFKLDGKIFLGWDKNNNRYRGFILAEPPQQIKILRRGEKLSSLEDLKNEKWPGKINETHFIDVAKETINLQDSIDDDMDRIYLHMQDRLLAVTKQLNSIKK